MSQPDQSGFGEDNELRGSGCYSGVGAEATS